MGSARRPTSVRLRPDRSKPGSGLFDQGLRADELGLEFVARAALGSKLNVAPISSTPSRGRRVLRDRRLDRLLRQAGLVADDRDRRVRRHGDRAAGLQRRDRARRVEDPDQALVLGLDEARLVGQLRVVAVVERHAPGEHEDGEHRDPDRHPPRCPALDERPPAERDRDAQRQQQRRDRQVARDHREPGRGDDQEGQQPEAAERERQRRAAAQDEDAEQQPEPADADRDDAVVAARVLRDQRDRLEQPAVAPELARHLARRGQRVQRLAGHDQVARHPDDRRGGDEQRVPERAVAAA